MARLNVFKLNFGRRTHEGAPARQVSTELQLRRSVLACLLWESQFYEDGVEIAGGIAELVPKVAAGKVAALAIEAREQMTVDVLYGDQEGGQRIVSRFVLMPRDDGRWMAASSRHWHIDRRPPR